MTRKALHALIGLSGVASDEREVARRWGKRFEIPMILVAIWLLVEWYAETSQLILKPISPISDIVVWCLFVLETTVISFLVKDPLRYLKSNWINVFIILMGALIIFGVDAHIGALRTLRLLLVFALFTKVFDTVRDVLSRHNLGQTLLVSLILIVTAGMLITGIDPNINSFADGIWWAWVTVTTVGYGDIVPGSPEGKVFGAILILLGVGLFSMLTAAFSAFFVSRDEEKFDKRILRKLDDIDQRLKDIEAEMKGNSDKK